MVVTVYRYNWFCLQLAVDVGTLQFMAASVPLCLSNSTKEC